MKVGKWFRAAMIPVLIIALSGVGWAATIEVSGYTKLTDNSDRYDRNPSIAYYDGEYWLFYTKGDDGTTNGVRGSYNPDNDSYVIWYKRAATVAGLASTSETRLDLSATDRPVGFDQRDVSAVVFNSNLYVFASAGFGGSDHPVWYYKWSASWSGPTSLGLLGMTGCGHANVTCDASQVYLVVEDGVAPTDLRSLAYTWNGTVLNGPYTIASGNGVPKITIKGSTLYVVSIAATTTAIEMHTSPVGATPSVWTWVSNPITVSGAFVWDPCVFNDGSTLYVVAAPSTSSPDQQWLVQTQSIDDGVIWSTEKRVSLGGYGSSYWWDFWPMGYYDGADKYLFFATEGNSPTYGDGEIAYIKMNWDLANDHYFFIQNAVDQAAPSGDVIQVAAGTFPEYLLMYKSITLQGQGVGSTIINASASPGRGIESEDAVGYNIVLQNFTLIGPVNLSGTAYGIKIAGENATAVITNVEVYGCTRSGVDLNGLNSGTITDLNSHHNGAAGLFLTDCSNITINGLTTAGNPWGGTAVATKGTYYTGGSSNVTFSGVLSLTDNLPIYTELNGPPYYAISGLTIPTSPLGYLVGTTANVYTQGYYATAAPALGWGPTAWAKNRVTGNYLVLSGMRIQAAVDAAASGDIIEVDAGTYPENVTINGSMTVKAALSATPVVDGAVLINTNNAVTLDSLTIHNGSNLLYGSTPGGIIVAGSGHTIKNCTLVGNGASGYYGIHVTAGTWNNLTIQDNDLSGWHGGLYLNPSSGHVISGNNFHNNIYVGIGSDGISNVSITGNTFSGHTHPSWGEGMGVSAAGVNVDVTGNRFFNNTFGIRNWGPSGTVNATCNYWSTMVYASILANISGSVNFEPWNDSTLANCTYTRLVHNITQLTNYVTIQAAIDAAASGDIIEVDPGTFPEGISTIAVDLTIRASNSDSPPTITPTASTPGGNLSQDPTAGWFVVNSGVSANFEYLNFNAGGQNIGHVIHHQGQGTISHCSFSNVYWGLNYGVGVVSRGAYPFEVEYCTFSNVERIGALFNHYTASPKLYHDNTFTGKVSPSINYACEAERGANVLAENNVITACTGVAGDGSTSAAFLATTYHGFPDSTRLTAHGNVITGNSEAFAIGYDASDYTVAVLTENKMASNTRGIGSLSTRRVQGILNWWGATGGPNPVLVLAAGTRPKPMDVEHPAPARNLDESVDGNVHYSPWIASNGNDFNEGMPGWQPDRSVLGVSTNGTIQEGVNLVIGSTVNVSPGTYEEQVVVNAFPTPLHIIGLGATPADVVIKGVASMPHEFTSARSAVLSIENTASVEVANLTVDGDGQGNTNNRYCGIAYWNSAGSVHDVHVTQVRWTPANGVQGGVGIYAYNNTGGPYVLNLTDVVVDDYQKGGVTMNGAGLTANLTNVTTTGYGPVTFIAQNGIQFGFGAGGSATNCHATGHTYTGTDDPEATSCGILVYQGSSVTVTGSTLNANQQGVYFLDTDGSVVNSTILADAQSIQGIVGDKSGTVLLNNNPDRGNVLNHRRPSPTSEPTSRSSYNLDTDLSFTVSGCTLTGSNVEWTVGVQAFSGSGNLAVTIQNNVVGNWGIGVAPYTCCGGTISNPLITNNDLSNIVNAFDDRDGYVITPGLWASNCYSDYGLNPGFGSGQYWIYNFALSVHSATDFSPNPNGCIYAVAPHDPHDLVVLVQSPHVVLHWRPSSSSEVVYNVYTDPSSTGAFSNLLGTTADTTFTDSNAVSLPDARRFYLVRTDRP